MNDGTDREWALSTDRPRRRKARRPVVSVCIVNWNCRDLLRNCLRSLAGRRQGLRLEIIVVDNASTDGAADMVARRFPHVRLIRNAANAGFSKGNNQAAAVARGRFLFFLNNDTIVPPEALLRLVSYAKASPEAGLIGPLLRDGQGRPQVSFRARPTVAALLHRTWLFRWTGLFRRAYRTYRARGGDFTQTRPVDVLMGAALLMRRSVFRRLGPWDERYTFGGEDIELCTRVGRYLGVVYHPAVEITHLGRVSSRRHIAYAHANTVIGHTRFLRGDGASPLSLWVYKAAVTLDAPLQLTRHVGQYLWRRLRGREAGAQRSLLVVRGVGQFLRQIEEFWRA